MWYASLWSLLPGPLGVVVPVRVPSIGQIDLFNNLTVCKQISDAKLNRLCYIEILESV